MIKATAADTGSLVFEETGVAAPNLGAATQRWWFKPVGSSTLTYNNMYFRYGLDFAGTATYIAGATNTLITVSTSVGGLNGLQVRGAAGTKYWIRANDNTYASLGVYLASSGGTALDEDTGVDGVWDRRRAMQELDTQPLLSIGGNGTVTLRDVSVLLYLRFSYDAC